MMSQFSSKMRDHFGTAGTGSNRRFLCQTKQSFVNSNYYVEVSFMGEQNDASVVGAMFHFMISAQFVRDNNRMKYDTYSAYHATSNQ